ncbi:MBL fold metallo-hydrolase [Mesorhizobium sp. M0006]|uniref:MBL fold metallo-hydrolase n=1 Tax=Mesorhizobium sp. M0006 TaxID=2956838 RepID=UPI00333D194F
MPPEHSDPHAAKLPYYYPFQFGDAEVTVVSDGPLELGDPGQNFLGVTSSTVKDMLKRNFLRTDTVVLEQNAPIIKMNGKTILFETGMGTSKIFGHTTGRLLRSMREAGIDPAEIDAVVLSHAHIDHCGGVCAEDGIPNFPNAQIYISQRDFEDWTDGSSLGDGFRVQVENARRNLLPVRDRIVFYEDAEEFLPGVQAIHAPGHTMGHHCFLVTSGREQFCFLGDLTHHHVLLFERPWMEFKYDMDPKLSARSRTRVLDMLATDGIQVMSYHFAWPGAGHVAKEGDGFRYFPSSMQLIAA